MLVPSVCLLAIVYFLHSATKRSEGISDIYLPPAFICCITDNTWSQRHTTSSVYLVASQIGEYWLTLLTCACSSRTYRALRSKPQCANTCQAFSHIPAPITQLVKTNHIGNPKVQMQRSPFYSWR